MTKQLCDLISRHLSTEEPRSFVLSTFVWRTAQGLSQLLCQLTPAYSLTTLELLTHGVIDVPMVMTSLDFFPHFTVLF